jgi:hypothetical protein
VTPSQGRRCFPWRDLDCKVFISLEAVSKLAIGLEPGFRLRLPTHANPSSGALRSGVSKPSVNQP